MLLYSLKCRKNIERKNPKVEKTKKKKKAGIIMLLSKCSKCGSKKSRFIKWQKDSGLLSGFGVKYRF